METGPDGNQRINSFALVSYIPDPLGKFLDDLRRELVPGCKPHAHVTMLPPRPLGGSPEQAWQQILDYSNPQGAFELELTEVSIFPITNVVYIELGRGRERLMDWHRALNQGVLRFTEPFPYHPHVTLAQEIDASAAVEIGERAKAAWAEFRGPRRYLVEEVTLVQCTVNNEWLDLAWRRLPRDQRGPDQLAGSDNSSHSFRRILA